MFLSIATTHVPATDLGFLLHKHPGRVQEFPRAFGTAHVFYPEAGDDRCTVALLLEVDSVRLARTRGKSTPDFSLGQYVSEWPVAVLAVVMRDGGIGRQVQRVRIVIAAGELMCAEVQHG